MAGRVLQHGISAKRSRDRSRFIFVVGFNVIRTRRFVPSGRISRSAVFVRTRSSISGNPVQAIILKRD
jgi:hypothetical protein